MEKYDTTKVREGVAEFSGYANALADRIENAEKATPVLEKLAEAFNEKKNAEEQFDAVSVAITALDALHTIDIKSLEEAAEVAEVGLACIIERA